MNKQMNKHLTAVARCGALVAVLVTIGVAAGCGGDNPTRRTPNVGDELTLQVEREGQLLYEATYRYYEIPGTENDPGTQILPLLENQTYHDPDFDTILEPEYQVTLSDLENLQQAIQNIPLAENDLAVDDLEDVLQILNEHQVGLPGFYEWWVAEGQPPVDEAIQELFEFDFGGPTPPQAQGLTRAGGLDVAKFAWEIIKDGQPKNDTQSGGTSILNNLDKNPLNYAGARREELPTYTLRGVDALTGAVLAEIHFRVFDWYGARHSNFGGYYIPYLYVQFTKVDLVWPVSARGSASVSGVANIGTADQPNPDLDMWVSITIYDWFESYTRTWRFAFKGDYGYYYLP